MIRRSPAKYQRRDGELDRDDGQPGRTLRPGSAEDRGPRPREEL